MNIESKLIKETVGRTATYATYTRKDIEKLILDDLASRGIKTIDSKVSLLTTSKYVEDEWGMNRYLQTSFDKAIVAVEAIVVELPNVDFADVSKTYEYLRRNKNAI